MQLSEQSFVPLPSKGPRSLTIVSFCCTTSLLLGISQKRCVFHCLVGEKTGSSVFRHTAM